MHENCDKPMLYQQKMISPIFEWCIGKFPVLSTLRGLFDKFEENLYKIVSVYSILLGFAYDTGKYVYDRYCKFLFNMFIRKKVKHVLLTYGNK